MHVLHPSSCTARRSPSASVHSHGRSHSLSDPLSLSPLQPIPHSSPASALEFYNGQSTTPINQNWLHATSGAGASISALPSPNPSLDQDLSVKAQPHVARRTTSPQSMVSSGSPKGGQSNATRSLSADSTTRPSSSRASGKRSSIDRNRKPCGKCSGSKRKCKLIPGMPNLCERCKSQGRTECPPHISWTIRKQNMVESGSLSPLELDDAAFSSRSTSPSYTGASKSPVAYPAVFQSPPSEHGMYADTPAYQEWAQAQSQAQGQGSPSSAELGQYEPFYVTQGQQPVQPQNGAGLHLPLHIPQSNPSLNPPALPMCHVCQTPYNEFAMLTYAWAQAQWPTSIPAPPYEHDPSMLKIHGQVQPPLVAPYENQQY